MELFLPDPVERLPLYRKYLGRCNPQSAYLKVDMSAGTAAFEWDGQRGGSQMLPDHIHLLPCPATLTGLEVHRLADDLYPLLARLATAIKRRDEDPAYGTDDFDSEVSKILVQLESVLDVVPKYEVWDADTWLAPALQWIRSEDGILRTAALGAHSVDSATTDAELEDIADKMDCDAQANGVLVEGLLVCLRALRTRILYGLPTRSTEYVVRTRRGHSSPDAKRT